MRRSYRAMTNYDGDEKLQSERVKVSIWRV
jgi:hypothetical protein